MALTKGEIAETVERKAFSLYLHFCGILSISRRFSELGMLAGGVIMMLGVVSITHYTVLVEERWLRGILHWCCTLGSSTILASRTAFCREHLLRQGDVWL